MTTRTGLQPYCGDARSDACEAVIRYWARMDGGELGVGDSGQQYWLRACRVVEVVVVVRGWSYFFPFALRKRNDASGVERQPWDPQHKAGPDIRMAAPRLEAHPWQFYCSSLHGRSKPPQTGRPQTV